MRFLILIAFTLIGSASAELLTGTVMSVHDCDILTLQSGGEQKKIRLAGIDAPELKQPFGPESRDALRQRLDLKELTISQC
jgi:micrococcal nuclease